jgi:hypothetical protein
MRAEKVASGDATFDYVSKNGLPEYRVDLRVVHISQISDCRGEEYRATITVLNLR